MWLFIAWIWLDADAIASSDSRIVERIIDLNDLVGASVTLAAVTFAAYLLGSILHQLSEAVVARPGLGNFLPFGGEMLRAAQISTYASRRADQLVETYGSETIILRSASCPAQLRVDAQETGSLSGGLAMTLMNELRYALVVRLQIERDSLWQTYDRLKSEAELRVGIVPPLVALIITAAVTWHPVLVGLLVIPAVLAIQAAGQRSRADAVVMQALLTGLIESPTIQELRG